MAVTLTTPKTLLGSFAPRTDAARLVSGLATIVLGSLLIAVASKINVPTWPIPVTLQTLAVALVAAAFGWRIGVATVVAYIAEGLVGLPCTGKAVSNLAKALDDPNRYVKYAVLEALLRGPDENGRDIAFRHLRHR